MKFLDADRLFFMGTVLVLAAVVVLVWYVASDQAQLRHMQDSLWQDYKAHIWDSTTGRTVNAQDDNVTTSEGQAYTMLRAVWENDPSTFAKTWGWTTKNLQRSDKLFSWRWGKGGAGATGIVTAEGGQNTAADADTDIAFALLMAGTRWHNQGYLAAGRTVIQHIWQVEVVSVHGRPYLAADNIEKTAATPAFVLNVSYLSPYAYRSFAKVDPSDHWQDLVGSSYSLITAASKAALDTGSSDGLPPNWVTVNRQTGAIQATGNAVQSTQFGFDAFRTVWRVALDFQWYHDARAQQALADFSFLHTQWQQTTGLPPPMITMAAWPLSTSRWPYMAVRSVTSRPSTRTMRKRSCSLNSSRSIAGPSASSLPH